ncbi:phosphatase PAP2 family protein [Pelagibacteraceae bacterium]|nr:phosphatase PAP2 family protein [Pelagibacteraceae bacterium]
MIKKIQIELVLLVVLIINIFLSYRADVFLYNYFFNFNYGFETSYLKSFFVRITELGDSLWYFLIIIFMLLVSFVGIKTKKISSKTYLYLRNFFVFSFFYLLLVGLVTQILKYIIGRPRPNYTNFDESIVFYFFSTDASFHSFPSGHSSTIIALSIILSLLIPRLGIFFFICGFVVAFSRVVVGAHFTSDIIAGGLVAIILYKIFLSSLKKRYPNFSAKNFEIKNVSLLFKSNVIFLILCAFVTIGYDIDVFLSGLFYFGDGQFFLQSYDTLSIIFRDILLPFLIIYVFIFPIIAIFFPFHQIYFGHKFIFKEIVFIWVTGFITLILVVNMFLKDMWGRTRPNDILQFGGNDFFTPWYVFGDSCISNCSFISGDASVGFAMIVLYFITKKNIYINLSILCGAGLGFIRIIAGGHFFSDIIFSQIIVTLTIFISFVVYKRLSNE